MMHRRRCAVVAAAVVVLVGVVGGCGRDPDPVQVQADADLAFAIAVGSSAQAMTRLSELYPDVPFHRDPEMDRHLDTWSDCSSSPAGSRLHPTAIVWASVRDVTVEPKRETVTLAEGLVESLVLDGWTRGYDSIHQYAQAFHVSRDGFAMKVSGVLEPGEDHASYVRVITYSPCIDGPENHGQWEWSPGPTEPPWPSPTPTIGPERQ